MSSPGITRRILRWYARHGRALPWRRSVDPYAIWVSEVMLQQTRVDTVVPFYERFLSRFPTVESLAAAPLQDVLKAWENMGYYSRARNFHKAAGVIVRQMGGRIPATYDELIRLPGVGRYTASAVLSIAFRKRVLALDGNVKRVICRLFAVKAPLDERRTLKKIEMLGSDLLPGKDSSSFNQALMDLGATICMDRNPVCDICPVREHCLAFSRNIQGRVPLRRKRASIPHREMTASVIRDRRGRVLVVQRPAAGLLGGLWKFPGGEKSGAETLTQAAQRTVHEEVGLRARAGAEIGTIRHTFTHFRMRLHVFECRKTGGKTHARGCARWQWAAPGTLQSLPFSKADRRIIEMIMPDWSARRKAE